MEEKYLVVFDRICFGPHGPYLVTYPCQSEGIFNQVKGSITVRMNGIEREFLESGVMLFVSGLHRKVKGWRAKKVWLASPEEILEQEANTNKSKGEER